MKLYDLIERMNAEKGAENPLVEVYDTSGNRYVIEEVYKSDDGPEVCIDIKKVAFDD